MEKSVTSSKGTTFTRTYWVNPAKVDAVAKKMPLPKLESLPKVKIAAGPPPPLSEPGKWLEQEHVRKAFSEVGHAFAEKVNPNTPVGVENVTAGTPLDKEALGVNVGCFRESTKTISLTEDGAVALRQAIANGGANSDAQMQVMQTLTHEIAQRAVTAHSNRDDAGVVGAPRAP